MFIYPSQRHVLRKECFLFEHVFIVENVPPVIYLTRNSQFCENYDGPSLKKSKTTELKRCVCSRCTT